MGSLKRLGLAALLLLLTAGAAFSQDQKQKLEPEDYGKWERIFGSSLSPDGEWFYYSVVPVDADGWLTLKRVGSDSTGEHKFMYGTDASFSDDNRWFAFRIGVSEKEEERLEEQERQVRYKLGLMDLESGETDTIPNIQSYSFNETGTHMVMTKYPPEGSRGGGGNGGGGTILVRDMSTGTTMPYGNVSDYAFNEEGTHLALALEATDKLGNGVHLVDLAENRLRVLDSDTAAYKQLTWSEEENNLAFLKEATDTDREGPTHIVHTYKNVTSGNPDVAVYDHREDDSFPADFRIVDYRSLNWADHNETVFFGIKPWEMSEEAKKDTTAADSAETEDLDADLDPSNVQVWHWKDDPIQPRQELMANSEQRSNFLSAWHLEDNNFVQLADSMVENVSLTGDHRHAIGYDPTPYEPQFEETWNDIYLVDLRTGERELLMQQREFVQSSPGGDYLYWFHAGDWRTYDIETGEVTNITANIDTRFENYRSVNGRTHHRPFGSGQWAEGDDWLLLYDEYDIWRVSPDGEDAERLTEGAADRIQYRQNRLDYEDDYLSDDETIWLSKYGYYTKDRGYAQLDGRDNLEELIYEPMQIGRLSKADDTDRFVYMKEAADDSPDFFATTSEFEEETQLTRTNPFQEDYYWADDELITFVNTRGDTLQGRLLYPANYQPGQQYPMITYIYELRSQSTHSYSTPSRTSPYNMRRYSSEGYFVFEPDINYELSDPGVSAVESVVPAVEKVIETGMIREDQIGLTGHSWGAYQTSFIVTQTDLFNSAVAGAPLTNMVSMYNSIYWNSGSPDAQIFEVSQGRFPDPWWMDWDNYIENSPIFQAENLDTPLLVEFGTDDGAVDFNQGVELYNTLRRMQKTYVMLVYEGENHGLAREENQIDYATRAFQWHEHFLKGEPAPDWINEGLPWIKRPEVLEEEGNGGGN